MWGGAAAKARELRMRRQALAARHTPKARIHLKRAKAEMTLLETGANIQSRILLNDMTSAGLYLYSAQPVALGKKIQLTLDLPAPFFVQGRVVSCQNIAVARRIISVHNYSYRIQIEFLFQNPADHKIVQHYCQDILGTYLRGV
jgi:hypothetical protein